FESPQAFALSANNRLSLSEILKLNHPFMPALLSFAMESPAIVFMRQHFLTQSVNSMEGFRGDPLTSCICVYKCDAGYPYPPTGGYGKEPSALKRAADRRI